MVTVDLFRILATQRAFIAKVVLIVTGAVLLFVTVYYLWLQPRRTVVALQFRPAFEGAREGEYPNKSKFAPTDVISGSVTEKVFAANQLQQYCPYHSFVSGLFTETSSPELRVLERDYSARLSDPRLTQVDRERIQSEYRDRLKSIDVQYRLSFMRAPACRKIPVEVVVKSLGQILEGWAQEADQRRGVLRLRVPVLTPAVLDVKFAPETPRLIRGEIVRGALVKVITNVRDVEKISGAELIRVKGPQASFAEVRIALEELVRARLDPMVSSSGDARTPESLRWVEDGLEETLVGQRAAAQRAEGYRVALREYSSVPGTSASAAGQSRQGGSPRPSQDELQSMVRPELDRSFIDRMLELSEPNAEFKEEMSREMIKETLVAVDYDSQASHFRRLLDVLRRGPGGSIPPNEFDRRLQAIVADGKPLIEQFNRLYEEFSSVSLRPGPQLYTLEGAPQVSTAEPFGLRDLVLIVAGALLLSLIAAVLSAIVRARFQAVVA